METLALLLWLCADPVVPVPPRVPDENPPLRRAVEPQDFVSRLVPPKSAPNSQNDVCMVCIRSEWFRNSGRRDD